MRRARQRAVGGLLLTAAVAGCVTSDLNEEPAAGPIAASAVIIPLAGTGLGQRDPHAEYYQSILMQMQDAVLERHPERLQSLCDQNDRASAPFWASEQIGRFRRIARILNALEFIAAHATIDDREAQASPVAIGQRMPLVFAMPASAGSALERAKLQGVSLRSGGGKAAARFQVQVEVVDRDSLGGRLKRSFGQILPLPEDVDLATESLRMPFDVDALAPEGVLREVDVRIDLLPGNVLVDGESLPNVRALCARRRFELLPRGHEIIREAPLRTLRNALRSVDPRHADNLFLAAHFMPESDRPAAEAALIERVRLGAHVQARAAMAALAVLSDEPISVEDREAWLLWWRDRSSLPERRPADDSVGTGR